MTASPDHNLTVAQLSEALLSLPSEVQDYAVRIEADPAMPVDGPQTWTINHSDRVVYL